MTAMPATDYVQRTEDSALGYGAPVTDPGPMTDDQAALYQRLTPAAREGVQALRDMQEARRAYQAALARRNAAYVRMMVDDGMRPPEISDALTGFAQPEDGVSRSNVRLAIKLHQAAHGGGGTR